MVEKKTKLMFSARIVKGKSFQITLSIVQVVVPDFFQIFLKIMHIFPNYANSISNYASTMETD